MSNQSTGTDLLRGVGNRASIYIPAGEVISVPVSPNPKTWIPELKTFFQSFHPGGSCVEKLRDPRYFEVYVLVRGLVTLLVCSKRREVIPWFDINYGPDDGGWGMYQAACDVGPGMVRWLNWAGKMPFWRGMHANLVDRVDQAPMFPALTPKSRTTRREVGFCSTALAPHHVKIGSKQVLKHPDHWELRWPPALPLPVDVGPNFRGRPSLRLADVEIWDQCAREGYSKAFNQMTSMYAQEKIRRNRALDSILKGDKEWHKTYTHHASRVLYTPEDDLEAASGQPKGRPRALTPELEDGYNEEVDYSSDD